MTRDNEYQEISTLLPFYVNGSATKDERARVDAAKAEDASLDMEIAALAQTRKTWQDLNTSEHDASPGEAGLARLMAAIEADQVETKITAAMPQPANINAPVWQRYAALAAAAAFGAVLSFAVLQPSEDTVGAEMVSGGSGLLEDMPTLTVAFQSQIAMGELSQILDTLELTIVDGPSASGFYRVAHFDGRAFNEDDAEALRARTQVFQMVDDPQ